LINVYFKSICTYSLWRNYFPSPNPSAKSPNAEAILWIIPFTSVETNHHSELAPQNWGIEKKSVTFSTVGIFGMALAGWSAWHWVLQLRHGAIGARLADSHEARDPFARLDWIGCRRMRRLGWSESVETAMGWFPWEKRCLFQEERLKFNCKNMIEYVICKIFSRLAEHLQTVPIKMER